MTFNQKESTPLHSSRVLYIEQTILYIEQTILYIEQTIT